MSATILHPDLGTLKGIQGDQVVQFLGIPYATIRDRFAPAVSIQEYGPEIDATKYGPPPVSPVGAIHREFGFIQHTLPIPDVPNHSDLAGLNLNITLPQSSNGKINLSANLPVYVFIHGGGFAVGSSWYPHYDPASIVRLSAQMERPMIGITINYRLGAAGFLSSRELREAGYRPNNGLHDQHTAMRWIKRFVSGFGGNPDRITAVGESAGGLSVTMFLCSKEPLMNRCLSTGGAVLLFKPLSPEAAESAYQKVIAEFGLQEKTPHERIEALLEAPLNDLWQKIPIDAPMLPTVDGDIVPGVPDFLTVSSQDDSPTFFMPGRKWCDAVMIGESKLDANILAYMGLDARRPAIAQKFMDSAKTTLKSQPEVAIQLLSAYNITPDSSDDDALLSILRFASEVSFYAPARAFAQGWPGHGDSKFFLYHFNEGIPWDGRFKGEAGHILDVAYLFQNFNEHLDARQRSVALRYAEDFINFVNGEDPWPATKPHRPSAQVYGPSNEGKIAEFVEDGDPVQVERNRRILELGEIAGYDKVLEVFQNFFIGQ